MFGGLIWFCWWKFLVLFINCVVWVLRCCVFLFCGWNIGLFCSIFGLDGVVVLVLEILFFCIGVVIVWGCLLVLCFGVVVFCLIEVWGVVILLGLFCVVGLGVIGIVWVVVLLEVGGLVIIVFVLLMGVIGVKVIICRMVILNVLCLLLVKGKFLWFCKVSWYNNCICFVGRFLVSW